MKSQRACTRHSRHISRRIVHYLRTSTVHLPYCSSDETSSRSWVHSFHPLVNEFANDPRRCSGLAESFIRSLVDGFHDGLHAILFEGWRGGSLILPLIEGFHNGLHAILLGGIARWIDYSSARRRLSQLFGCRMARRKVSRLIGGFTHIFRLSMTLLTFYAPWIARRIAHSSARRRQLSPASSRTVFLSRWQWITHSCTRQWLSRRFAHRIAQRMAADCSYIRSSKGFTTDCASYCSASGLLILPLINGFHDGLRVVFNSGWQRIAHSFSHQRLSRRFSRRIAQRMAVYCSFFHSSMAFTTVCAPYCSADCSALLILPLINGFHNGLRPVLLSGWQRSAHYSARQRLS